MTRRVAALVLAAVLAAVIPACARPHQPGGTHVASTTVPVPGGCDVPRTGPADAVGCYVAGTEQLGAAPTTPLFWHLDAYPTRAAAEAERRGRGTVAEAHGRVWLFTIAEAEWRPERGECVARVGPLPLTPGRSYAAYYIEGVVPPGARTPAHHGRHRPRRRAAVDHPDLGLDARGGMSAYVIRDP